MEQKRSHKIYNRYTIGAFTLLTVFVAVFIFVITKRDNTEVVPVVAKSAATAKSPFSFDAAAAVGWRKGPTNDTSMALFNSDHSCFTSIQYKPGTVNVASDLQKNQADLVRGGSTSMPGAVLPVELQTSAGQQEYELHQYSVSGTESMQLMGGLELGYLQLADGYLKIDGHCNTADELPTTIPALRAITFDKID